MKKVFGKIGVNELSQVSDYLVGLLDDFTVICFYGSMGAGKTTLIKEVLKMARVKDNVSSPTFSLVNEYASEDKNIFYHFDFYRINHINEAYDIGAEEYLYSGNVCLIEWPEKVEELLPVELLKVTIEVLNEQERKIEILTN